MDTTERINHLFWQPWLPVPHGPKIYTKDFIWQEHLQSLDDTVQLPHRDTHHTSHVSVQARELTVYHSPDIEVVNSLDEQDKQQDVRGGDTDK